MRTNLLCIAALSVCLPLSAELCLRGLTLSQAEELSLEYNKKLLIAREGTVAAGERKQQAISKWLPSIHYNAQAYQLERQEFFFDVFNFFPQLSKYGYQSFLQLDQPLFSSDLLFGLFGKQLEEKTAVYDQASTYNELLFAVRESYYAVALQELGLEIQRENVTYLSEALRTEQQKLDAGNSTPFEVNQSKVSVANAISQYYETLKTLKNARNALIITLGINPLLEPELSLEHAEIPLSSIPEIVLKMHEVKKKYRYASGDFPSTDDFLLHITRIEEARKLTLFSECEVLEYIELAIRCRPDLERTRLYVGVAEQNLKEKKGKYLPEIAGFVRYSYNEGMVGTESFAHEKYYFTGGVALRWNIFDSFLREHKIREAASQKRSARIAFDKDLQAIEVQVRNGLYQFEEALMAYLSADQAVLVAEQARFQAQEKLEFGRIYPLEYRDSVNQLSQARNMRNRASYQLIDAYYLLRFATGQDMAKKGSY